MKTIKQHWKAVIGMACLCVSLIIFARNAWAQSQPGLSIAASGTNQVTITVTNAVTNGLYQLYWTEFLGTPSWQIYTNGTTGQTNFKANTADYYSGFFQATYNSGYTPPSINIVIISPTNGALLY